VLCPVVGATFFLITGYPSWRIAKLTGDTIVGDALPVTGLPSKTAWTDLLGRYPDTLYMRVYNSSGGEDWYEYKTATRSWSLDSRIQQRRGTVAYVEPWKSRRLLVVFVVYDRLSAAGFHTTMTTLPNHGSPGLPSLPRTNPSSIATSPAGDLFAAYSDPPEAVVVRRDSGRARRYPLRDSRVVRLTSLEVVSRDQAYVVGSKPDSVDSVGFRFDGTSWQPMELPPFGPVGDLVALSDGTLWCATFNKVWKRQGGGEWTFVSLPADTRPPYRLAVSSDRQRLWLVAHLVSGEQALLTIGAVRERSSE